ncbi:hypothetical protein SAMD00019534_118140, partial [Acytostelium subglobosum LB1]|uniref:hypothetical protein n=1 Tax=Acytostelium subglobosum LB1 TaxID=1410327 RepID=UPI000644BA35
TSKQQRTLESLYRPTIRITNGHSFMMNADPVILETIHRRMTFFEAKTHSPFQPKKKMFHHPRKVSFFSPKVGRFATGLLPIIISELNDLDVQYNRIDERNPLPQLYSNWDHSIKLPPPPPIPQKPVTKTKRKKAAAKDTQLEVEPATETTATTSPDDQATEDDIAHLRVFDLQPPDLESKRVDDSLLLPTVKLHDFQVESINFALANHRGIIKCATGGGKTMILASLIKALGDDVTVVILVTKRSLVTQIYDSLKATGVCQPGRVSSDYFEPSRVTISTLKSAHKIADLCRSAQVMMVDEVHEFASPSARQTFKMFDNAYSRFGFSATPFKVGDPVHNHRIISVFGTLLCDISTQDLTKIDILSNAYIHFYPINYPLQRKTTITSFHDVESRLVAENEHLNQSIAKLVESIPTGRIMILVKRLAHGDALSELIPDAYWVKGDDGVETREFVLNKLKHSKNEKVVAIFSAIGYVGVDVRIHHLINASGGKDPNMTLQKLGRGLRKADDKTHLDYHDFFFSPKVHKALSAHSSSRMSVLRREGHQVIMEPELP